MQPKTLAAYLCSHMLVVGAGQTLLSSREALLAERPNMKLPVQHMTRDSRVEVRIVRAPNPAVLADDDAWRLFRSQIVFLAQLP